MKLSPKQRQTVLSRLDQMFMELKARMLGRFFRGPSIYFQVVRNVDPMDTMEGLYQHALTHTFGPAARPDEHTLESLAEITSNYIDAYKLKTANKMVIGIAQAKNSDEAIDVIKDTFHDATKYVETLIPTETKTAQAYAEREGIAQVASSLGVSDPTVAKLGVIDNKMCDVCRKLWHSDDNIRRPKLYKMSELQEGYNTDRKNPIPTIGASHPHCRHTLTLVAPGYDFNENGVIEFVGLSYDAYKARRDNKT